MLTLSRISISNWIRSCITLSMIGLLLLTSSASAQAPGSFEKQRPVLDSKNQSQAQTVNIVPLAATNPIQDPSFEASAGSSAYWGQSSTNFGTPVCPSTAPSPTGCGNGGGTAGPHTGSAWVWFGGTTLNEYGIVSQSFTIPTSCTATLQFYLWIGFAQSGSDAADNFAVLIDLLGPPVFQANATQKNSYAAYTLVSVNLNAYANGSAHTLDLTSSTNGQIVTFNVDDVSLVINCPITGNAGVAGATLAYTDDAPKSVQADGSGNYTISAPFGWTGTVTPKKIGYQFTPANKSYSNVQSSQTAQNYTASVCASCADKDTVGVFRPSNGALYLRNLNITGFADVAINYGLAGDYPVVGDWNGDGTDTIGIYRNGTFYLRNSNTLGIADLTVAFGSAGDQPIAGDWNNDGTDTIGVYRTSTGTFLLRNTNTPGVPDVTFALGNPGDVGIAGDWNGDGLDTTGVFRPSNGVIFLKNTNASGFADIALNYGLPGDQPVVGDWDNNGTTTIGIYRNARFYLRNSNTNGFANILLDLGNVGDMPIGGNWDAKP